MIRLSALSPFLFVSVLLHAATGIIFSGHFSSPSEIEFSSGARTLSVNFLHSAFPAATESVPVSSSREPTPSLRENLNLKRLAPSQIASPEKPLAETNRKPVQKKPNEPEPPSRASSLFDVKHTADQGNSDSEVKASVLAAPKPPYPLRARKAGFEGKLLLQVEISARGDVKQVTLLKSSGRADCDQSALRTIQDHWKFTPATRLGARVASTQKISVAFQLD